MKNRVKLIDNQYLSFPKIINIELLDYCPLACPHCFKKNDKNIISKDKLESIIEEAGNNGVKSILLSGGEPLLYPDLIYLIKKIKSYDIFTAISTSGVGLTEEFLLEIKCSGLDILYVSLNDVEKEINNLSRDGYENAIEAIRMCKEHSVRYRINWVARHDNVYNLPNLIVYAKEHLADGIDILANKQTISGVIESPLNKKDLLFLLNVYKDNNDYLSYQTCFTQLKNRVEPPARSILLQGCSAGLYSMTVFCDGTFSMCPHIYCNLSYERINDYWNNDKNLIAHRRKMLIKSKSCISCKFYETCLPCALFLNDELGGNCLSYEKII